MIYSSIDGQKYFGLHVSFSSIYFKFFVCKKCLNVAVAVVTTALLTSFKFNKENCCSFGQEKGNNLMLCVNTKM